MVYCNVCGKKVKRIKEETAGISLILLIVPFIYLFGINAGSIIGILMFLFVGLYWIITKPSKKYICKECLDKESLRRNSKPSKSSTDSINS